MIKIFRYILFVIIIASSWSNIFAQNTPVDSLKLQLQNLSSAEKIPVLLQIAEHTNVNDLSLSIKFVNEALGFAEIEKDQILIADCQKQLGNYYYELGNNAKARFYFGQALQIYVSEGSTKDFCNIYINIGSIYSREGIFDTADYYFSKSLNKAQYDNDTLWIVRSLRFQGNVLYNRGDYEKALSIYYQAINLSEGKAYCINEQSKILNNLGVLFYNLGKYDESLKYYYIALNLVDSLGDKDGEGRIYNNLGNIYWNQENLDSALLFYNKSLKIRESLGDIKGLAYVQNNIGMYYGYTGNYNKSLEYFNKSILSFESLVHRKGRVMVLFNTGYVYFEMKNYSLAKKYFSQSLRIARAQGFSGYIRDNIESLKEIYVATHNWEKAYEYLSSYNKVRDSIRNIQNLELLAEMEVKFEKERKQASLNIVQNKIRAAELKRNKVKISIWGVFIIIGLIIISTYLILRHLQAEANVMQDKMIPKLLRYQLNPQFINSSLNGVRDLIVNNDIKQSSMFLAGFSKIVRSFIEAATSNAIVLEKELEVTQKFFSLHQLRYPDRLSLLIDIAPYVETEMLAVPPFLVFPIYVHIIDNYLKIGDVKVDIDIDIHKSNLTMISTIYYSQSAEIINKGRVEINEIIDDIQERLDLLNKTLKEKLKIKQTINSEEDGRESISLLINLPIKPV